MRFDGPKAIDVRQYRRAIRGRNSIKENLTGGKVMPQVLRQYMRFNSPEGVDAHQG